MKKEKKHLLQVSIWSRWVILGRIFNIIRLRSYGIVRRNSVSENQQSRLGDETRDNLNIYYGDLLDQGCLEIIG
jgi:hypothetical protein